MVRTSEKKVQEKALEYLRRKYRARARWRRVFAQTEVRTRRQYGGKRADGLLAYRSWWGRLQVVSLEAKSHKTLPALRPRRQDRDLIVHSFWTGLAVCLGSGAFFFFWKMDDPYLQYAFPLNILVAMALLYGYLSRSSSRHKKAWVLDQLNQYPANRQWLAISEDGLGALAKKEQQHLRKICKRRGIGILLVNARGKVRSWLKPAHRRKWFGDFLQYYSREKEIRKALA